MIYYGISFSGISLLLHQTGIQDLGDFKTFLIIAIVIMVIATLFFAYTAPSGIRKKALKMIAKEENRHILNETELVIDETGILNKDKDSTVQLKWTSIVRYAATSDYYFLYTNSIQAQVIPVKLFSSPSERDAFEKFIESHIPLSSSFRSLEK